MARAAQLGRGQRRFVLADDGARVTMDLSKVSRLYSGAIWRRPEAVRLRATRMSGERSTRQVPGSRRLSDLPAGVGDGVDEEPLEVAGRKAPLLGARGAVPFGSPSPGGGGRARSPAVPPPGPWWPGRPPRRRRSAAASSLVISPAMTCFEDLAQVGADGLADDVEDLVAERDAHVLHLLAAARSGRSLRGCWWRPG